MIITLAGMQGAGKSTVGRLLAQKLQYQRYSTGDFMRAMAQERGMTILELNQSVEGDNGVLDKLLDDTQKRIGETEDNLVIDGRLAFHFIPHSFKVYLQVREETGASRILGDTHNRPTENNADLQTTIQNTRERRESESKRYLQYYGIDNHALQAYDLVIDTTEITPEQTVETILKAINEH